MKIDPLTMIWFLASASWISGYLYAESNGLMFQELGEVIPLTALPPLVPLLLWLLMLHVLAALGPP